MIPMVEQYEFCWQTGAYMDLACELCPHRGECSGAEDDNDEDDGK